jgi:hypothetical protein
MLLLRTERQVIFSAGGLQNDDVKMSEKQLDVLKIVNSQRPPWGWHRVCRNICRGKKSVKESVVHLLDW